MVFDDRILDNAIDSLVEETTSFLCELIRIPSTRGKEGPVARLAHERMKGFCTHAELMQIPESFKEDPLYSWPLDGLSYADTQNARLIVAGTSPDSHRSLILNAHTDVVPASGNQQSPFEPRIQNEVVFGRGACDDKGQIAVIYLLLGVLNKLRLRPRGTITVDLVIEEENGGNGTLFMVRHPVQADGAIVMEPSEGKIFAAVRGAVWFELVCHGKPGHSGRTSDVVSALKESIKAIGIIEGYHDRLLATSRGVNPLFDKYENPMPVTFGMMNAGDWPATAPATASVKGVFGFLPNTNVSAVQGGMIEAITSSPHVYLRDHCELHFRMLNNDGNELSPEHPLVHELSGAARDCGHPAEISAMTAACDAWRYSSMLNIPTVVMGAGSLKYAHSNEEQIAVKEIVSTAKVLLRFLERWCGFSSVLESACVRS